MLCQQPGTVPYVFAVPPDGGPAPIAKETPWLRGVVTMASFRSAESASNQRSEAGDSLPVAMSTLFAWHPHLPKPLTTTFVFPFQTAP